MSVAIQIDCLSKRYLLGEIGGGRLVDDFNRWLAKWRGKEDPLAKVGDGSKDSGPEGRLTGEALWALKNVSFDVIEGEVLGIVGRNGAGKSTLLKILSRVTAPTEGEVRVRGRIASLLEVGTGFHPELTGRENVYLNGAILGMTKSEIRRKFDEIVAFSELEKFIDTPVKRYSSGMAVRLAFAVAAHLEPEILIMDEVLAVGDASFQRKCLGKMKDVAGEGRTILFVSHNMEAVRRLCTRAVWLQQGTVHMVDEIDKVVDAYAESFARQATIALSNRGWGLNIYDICLRNQAGNECTVFRPGDDLVVEVYYEAAKPIPSPYFSMVVQGFKGSCFAANMLLDGHQPKILDGKGQLTCTFKSIPLLPQNYTVQLAIRAKNGKDLIIANQDVASFTVSTSLTDFGFQGEFMGLAAHSTSMVIPYQWHLPDGSVADVALDQSHDKALESLGQCDIAPVLRSETVNNLVQPTAMIHT